MPVETDGDQGDDIPGNILTIGRSPDNDLVVSAQQVSRHHAGVMREGSGIVIEDPGSANHTFVIGRQFQGRHYINYGDSIQLFRHWTLNWNHPVIANWLRPQPSQPVAQYPQTDHWGGQASVPDVSDGWGVSEREQQQPVVYQSEPGAADYHAEQARKDKRAMASGAYSKSYAGAAFLCWVLNYVGFFVVGFILDIVFLSSANKFKQETGVSPSGKGCLSFQLFIHVVPLIFLIILLATIGFSIPDLVDKVQGWF